MSVGDSVFIQGEENPSTGYQWFMEHIDPSEEPIYKALVDSYQNDYYDSHEDQAETVESAPRKGSRKGGRRLQLIEEPVLDFRNQEPSFE